MGFFPDRKREICGQEVFLREKDSIKNESLINNIIFFGDNYVQTFLYFFEEILQDMGYFFRISGGKFKTKEILKSILYLYYVFFILHC